MCLFVCMYVCLFVCLVVLLCSALFCSVLFCIFGLLPHSYTNSSGCRDGRPCFIWPCVALNCVALKCIRVFVCLFVCFPACSFSSSYVGLGMVSHVRGERKKAVCCLIACSAWQAFVYLGDSCHRGNKHTATRALKECVSLRPPFFTSFKIGKQQGTAPCFRSETNSIHTTVYERKPRGCLI